MLIVLALPAASVCTANPTVILTSWLHRSLWQRVLRAVLGGESCALHGKVEAHSSGQVSCVGSGPAGLLATVPAGLGEALPKGVGEVGAPSGWAFR